MRREWVGKWCVRTVASGVGDCCRQWPWLLKYIIYVIKWPQRFAEHFYFSLRTSAYSAVNIELIPALIGSFNHPATAARQGGSVAASLVDSCELRTADKHGYCDENKFSS